MKQLLDQTRGQMSSLHCIVELLESETQAEILTLLKQNMADIQKVLHRARSIRSEQGILDDQSSFNFAQLPVDNGLVPSYEAQLAQSSAYQRAKAAPAEELLDSKIELMSENYELQERVDNLILDANLKDEKVSQLEGGISSRDKRVSQLEDDIIWKNLAVFQLKRYLLERDEKIIHFDKDFLLKDERIATLEDAILAEDELMLVKNKKISDLEDAILHNDKFLDTRKDADTHWAAKSVYMECVDRLLRQDGGIRSN